MNRKEWQIKAECELRCEVAETEPLYIKLITGNAEIFGIEMAPGKEYAFLDENFAIYSWYGCVIETIGNPIAAYISDSTPMIAYVNTHIQLEARRDFALGNMMDGPRVLVVGPSDHGKSTTSRILAAYAARLDRTPIYVDLDVGQNALTIPGCVAAMPLDKTCINIEEGFANLNPLIYFHGHNTIKDNIEMYKLLVSNLANIINLRFDRDPDAKASGIIVNTSGWIDGLGINVLFHIIHTLSIDIILVMNHDKLYSSLSSEIGENITIIKLPHSGGVVQREANSRRRHRKNKVRQYFYGRYKFPSLAGKLMSSNASSNTMINMTITLQNLPSTFSPSRQSLKLSQYRFYRAGGLQLSEGMRLIGEATSSQDNTQLIKINPSNDLVNSIIAVLHPPDDEITNTNESNPNHSSTIGIDKLVLQKSTNVAGFLCIVQMDVDMDTITVLSPCPGAMPSKHFLVGSLKWVE